MYSHERKCHNTNIWKNSELQTYGLSTSHDDEYGWFLFVRTTKAACLFSRGSTNIALAAMVHFQACKYEYKPILTNTCTATYTKCEYEFILTTSLLNCYWLDEGVIWCYLLDITHFKWTSSSWYPLQSVTAFRWYRWEFFICFLRFDYRMWIHRSL